MPPFRSQRFDPYGEGGTSSNPSNNGNNTLPNAAGTARQRTLVGNGRSPHSSENNLLNSGVGGHNNTTTPPSSYNNTPNRNVGGGGRPMHPSLSSGNLIHDNGAVGISHRSSAYPSAQGHNSNNSPYTNSYVDRNAYVNGGQFNNAAITTNSDVVMGKTGAAPLATQVHPLMEVRKRAGGGGGGAQQSQGGGGAYNPYSGADKRGAPGGNNRRHHSHHASSPYQSSSSTGNFLQQSKRIISLLLGQIPEDDILAMQKLQQYGLQGSSEEEILMKLLSAKSTVRILRLFLLIPLLIFTSKRIFPPLADRMTRPKAWRWSAGVALPGQKNVPSRNLAGRNCVMNYFIEKQPPDEYDPDFVEIKPGKKNKDGTPKVQTPVKIVEGTYRTKGQVHVISRFVEAVADSFRSNTGIRQHIIFTESRDSGHLAYEAMRHWPPRGKHRTTVHVIASDELPHDKESLVAAKALGYGSLEDIEERFKGNERARIYDRDGNIAGLSGIGEDVDDDEVLNGMDIEVPDGETLAYRMKGGRRMTMTNGTLADGTRPYPNLRALLPFEEEDDGEGEIVVPYLHVDGESMASQLVVLESARSLLEEKKIVAVGIEHSPDMDVRRLIEFFADVRYKTFFLGARQIARIDNLCDEVLDDVLEHPSIKQTGSMVRRFFIRLGLISKEELRISGTKADPEGPKRRETPPFFVAMPRGRRNKEEMTIQHMYDLFGGYGGGGGQIKTANDRKAPGAK